MPRTLDASIALSPLALSMNYAVGLLQALGHPFVLVKELHDVSQLAATDIAGATVAVEILITKLEAMKNAR